MHNDQIRIECPFFISSFHILFFLHLHHSSADLNLVQLKFPPLCDTVNLSLLFVLFVFFSSLSTSSQRFWCCLSSRIVIYRSTSFNYFFSCYTYYSERKYTEGAHETCKSIWYKFLFERVKYFLRSFFSFSSFKRAQCLN